MGFRIRPLPAAVGLACISMGMSALAWSQESTAPIPQLGEVVVTGDRISDVAEPARVDPNTLRALAAGTSDTATLLRDVPGVAMSSAGGVSSLPVIHGLADDRNRIKVDGMDLISACGNHMNSPLSYIDPTNVESIQVYSGVTPVSVGGDAIGGTVVVKSRGPRFAQPGQGLLTTGELGAFYRSNGNGNGAHASATLASENLSITFNGSTAESDDYKAGGNFKPGYQALHTTAGSHWISGDTVGSSAYKARNQSIDIAARNGNHVVDLKVGTQDIPYQGFPNQHMDMTSNKSDQFNLGYSGLYDWGKLEARMYYEHTRHKMNFYEDKLYWYGGSYTIPGMPMATEGKNTGATVKAEINLNPRDILRLGAELQHYRLNDWWDPSGGGMAPDTFINIKDGKRDRFDVFAEWEARWNNQWGSLLGIRSSTVKTDAGTVHGYNTSYNTDANAFNNKDRSKTDNNLDLTALARYTANANLEYEGGYSRKTRSPSLYERYTWSTGGMAMTMNDWVNDGNGYKGNVDLKPEVAHTLSFTADWHDASKTEWGLRVTPYYSLVKDYIDATRCGPSNSGCVKTASNLAGNQFAYLTLANEEARLYGLDISGFFPIAKYTGFGSFTGRGQLSYTHGKNQDTGDHLYNIMPLNAKLAVDHQLGNWTNTAEMILVSRKDDVSSVRNEMETGGYGLLNLRSSYNWKQARLDIGLDNVFNRLYSSPLGGAYIGQGRTMSLNGTGAPYGITVPGMGRSLYAGVTVKF